MSLVAEATKKSGLVWIKVSDAGKAVPTWHHWHNDAAYVIAGGPEQPVRGLAHGERVVVTVRSKSTGGRIVNWVAAVTTVDPGSAEWAEVVPDIHANRLNSPAGTPERWAYESTLFRLDPTGETE